MTTTPSNAAHTERNLLSVSDESLALNDHAEDVRNYTVVDRTGEDIGQVDDLLVDDREHKVRFLRIKEGGFLGIGAKHFLIPVDAITRIDGEHVHVDQERSHVASGPDYDPAVAADEVWRNEAHGDGGYYEGLYSHYGRTPYWAPGYAYPGFPFFG